MGSSLKYNFKRRIRTLFKRVDEMLKLYEESLKRPVSIDYLLPKLDEDDLKYLCRYNIQLYQRGLEYYMQGRVKDRCIEFNTLKARVIGRSKPYYDTSLTFLEDANGYRIKMNCTCPSIKHNGGICKHIVSIIIAWIREPATFSVNIDYNLIKEANGSIIIAEHMPKIMGSLYKVVECIDKSSIKEDIEILKHLGMLIKKIDRIGYNAKLYNLTNAILLNIMEKFDTKYGSNIINIYKDTILNMLDKVIDNITGRKDIKIRNDNNDIYRTWDAVIDNISDKL